MTDIRKRIENVKRRMEVAQGELFALDSEELQVRKQLEDGMEKIRIAKDSVDDAHVEMERFLSKKVLVLKRKDEAASAYHSTGLKIVPLRLNGLLFPNDQEAQESAANAEDMLRLATAEVTASVAEFQRMSRDEELLEAHLKSAHLSLLNAEKHLKALQGLLDTVKEKKEEVKRRIEQTKSEIQSLKSDELQFRLQELEDAKDKVRLAKDSFDGALVKKEEFIKEKNRAMKRKEEAASAYQANELDAVPFRLNVLLLPGDQEAQEKVLHTELMVRLAAAEVTATVAELQRMSTEEEKMDKDFQSANKSLLNAEILLKALQGLLVAVDL